MTTTTTPAMTYEIALAARLAFADLMSRPAALVDSSTLWEARQAALAPAAVEAPRTDICRNQLAPQARQTRQAARRATIARPAAVQALDADDLF